MEIRKVIAVILVGVMLLPTFTFAQTTSDRDMLIQQLIAVLMQKVQLLQEKLEALEDVEEVAERVYEEKEAEMRVVEEVEEQRLESERKERQRENQAAQEEAEAAWRALPICPIRDGECRPKDAGYGGTLCFYINWRASCGM